MPIKVNENGEASWVVPTDVDINQTMKDISNPVEQSKEVCKPVINNNAQLWSAVAEINNNTYKAISKLNGSNNLVDIIVPVYNSIHIARECIEKCIARTDWPFHIYIVDDASDEFTKVHLADLQSLHPDKITLLTNKHNRGFAASVNRGIKAGKGNYICLLNSDVIVTPLWLTKMVIAINADKRNQIVCPATNNTAVVDIPMSPGASYLNMNMALEKFAMRRYPEIMPTGFCFMFRRELIGKIGLFDESFISYGEETAFWWQTIRHIENNNYERNRAVMAEDTYVFHERGTSFTSIGESAHSAFRKMGSGRFNSLYPEWREWQKTYDVKKQLGNLKEPIPTPYLKNNNFTYNIAWVVFDPNMCGGMKFISDIVNEMNERGANAKVVVVKRRPEQEIKVIGCLRTAPIIFENYEDFTNNFPNKVFKKGVVVAATVELSPIVSAFCKKFPDYTPLLHSQSYEPFMVDEKNKANVEALFSLIPNIITSSSWVNKEVSKFVTPFADVVPGVDQMLFYPREGSRDERPTVMIPLIANYPWRGYDRGLHLVNSIENAANEQGIDIRILIIGTDRIPTLNNVVCLGVLPQTRLAKILGTEVDVFIDPSTLHSYGMPALEAMASGVKVFSWNNKGINEYSNEAYPENTDTNIIANDIVSYLKNPTKQLHSYIDRHDRRVQVDKFIESVETHFKLSSKMRKIHFISPHFRKHGGPSTILELAQQLKNKGHDVSATSIYSDIKDEVINQYNIPINLNPNLIPRAEVYIVNSDNPIVNQLDKLPGKKILLKLSHNPRFKKAEEDGMNSRCHAIVTSSDWLKQVCENPTKDWNYRPRNATRIGWWNHGFRYFNLSPQNRKYGQGTPENPFVVGTLIHNHPTKGSTEALDICSNLNSMYGNRMVFIGVGEVPPNEVKVNLSNFKYKFAPTRTEMAQIMGMCDLWISHSHSEGLGRMGLEAMGVGCIPISNNTNAEYHRSGDNCLNFSDKSDAINKIVNLLSNPAERGRIAVNAYETACFFSNPEPCIDALETVINEVMK